MTQRQASRLAIGTAQFGSAYGVANKTGQPRLNQVETILEVTREHHIDTLDTAITYGDAESVLGEAGVDSFAIVSKLPTVPDECTDVAQWVTDQVNASLARLRVPKLHGLLLHRPDQILAPAGSGIIRALERVKASGMADNIGVSVYGPEDLDAIWQVYSEFDLVQAPINILDRRLITSGWLERLGNENVELHARSVFLQGLLLLPAAERPDKFNRWNELWHDWDAWLSDNQLEPLAPCLQFLLSLPDIAKIVVGVEQADQLREIVAATESEMHATVPDTLQCEDTDLINPAHWDQL